MSDTLSLPVYRARSRRSFLATSLATAGALCGTRLPLAEATGQVSGPRKKLIGWGTDVAYPSKVQSNIRKIEELPLDGIVLSNFRGEKDGREFSFDWECFGKQKFERRHLDSMIMPKTFLHGLEVLEAFLDPRGKRHGRHRAEHASIKRRERLNGKCIGHHFMGPSGQSGVV